MTLGRILITYTPWHGMTQWVARDESGLVLKTGHSSNLEKAKASAARWAAVIAKRESLTVTKATR